MHRGKLDRVLEEQLIDACVATLGRDSHGRGVMRLPRSLAAFVMVKLSHFIGKELGASIITDQAEYPEQAEAFLALGENEAPKQFPRDGSDVSIGVIQDLLIDFVDPRTLSDTPMAGILAFRTKYRDQMRRFREAIEKQVAEISAITNQHAYADAVQNANAILHDEAASLRSVMKNNKLDFAENMLRYK